VTRALHTSLSPHRLADRELHRLLQSFIQRRVPRSEVDDLVQTVLCDALAASRAPESHGDLRRWLVGIARHKIADHYRTAGRERPTDLPQVSVEPPPYEARSMVRWAERAASTEFAPAQTLGWLAREGEGESLATIASDEEIPAPRVRQRVSRLRQTLKERWMAELAAAVAVVLMVFAAWQWWSRDRSPTALENRPTITPDGVVTQAHALRRAGLQACENGKWRHCLELLDQAKLLDSTGDRLPTVGAARKRAAAALKPSAPVPTSAPSASTAPTAPAPSTSPTSGPTGPSPLPKRSHRSSSGTDLMHK
jgi:DNA-directed RNA polymerase specialized sigma24 family protein